MVNMKVTVEMSAEQFAEFVKYSEAKALEGQKVSDLRGKLRWVCDKVHRAIDADARFGEYCIVDQTAAAELVRECEGRLWM